MSFLVQGNCISKKVFLSYNSKSLNMKISKSLTIALILSAAQFAYAQSQDAQQALCDKLIQVDVDSAQGLYSVASRENIIVTNGKQDIEFVFLIVDKTIIVNISLKGSVYCIDETSKVSLKLKDGSDFDLPNGGKFNCDGEFSLFFGGGSGRKR